MGLKIGKSIGSGLKHYDGNRERDNVLLKGQVSIGGDKDVEVRRREGEQLSILERRPPICRAVFTS